MAIEQPVDHSADLAHLEAGQTVCDIGCGYDATACRPSAGRGAQVTSLTISTVLHARQCGNEGVVGQLF